MEKLRDRGTTSNFTKLVLELGFEFRFQESVFLISLPDLLSEISYQVKELPHSFSPLNILSLMIS